MALSTRSGHVTILKIREDYTLKHYRATRAVIDGTALENNFTALTNKLTQGELMPVIKADAYGHSAVNTSLRLSQQAKAFAVAIAEEGIQLRNAGVQVDIIVLEGVYSKEALLACFEYRLTPVLHCDEQIGIYASLDADTRPQCWVKYDIGMHRLGFSDDNVVQAYQKLKQLAPLSPVLCGHFSCADNPDSSSTPEQQQRFIEMQRQLGCEGSLANSPAVTLWPDSHVAWNRAGIAIYGVSASDKKARPSFLTPVMTLLAPVIAIRTISAGETVGYGDTWQAERTSVIATVAIGYADGYPRHAPTGTPVWINGIQAKLVGRVSMDMITIDITDLENVTVGDEVELWGKHLAVEEIADCCGTIAYELVTRVGPRVPRIFID